MEGNYPWVSGENQKNIRPQRLSLYGEEFDSGNIPLLIEVEKFGDYLKKFSGRRQFGEFYALRRKGVVKRLTPESWFERYP